jgi:hypothetical protein
MLRFAIAAALVLATPVIGSGQDNAALAPCGSQRFATVAMGEAVDRLRGARVFAETPERRRALASLEANMVEIIQSEPDSNFRGAAWGQADKAVWVKDAEDDRRRFEERVAHYAVSLAKTGAGGSSPIGLRSSTALRWQRSSSWSIHVRRNAAHPGVGRRSTPPRWRQRPCKNNGAPPMD